MLRAGDDDEEDEDDEEEGGETRNALRGPVDEAAERRDELLHEQRERHGGVDVPARDGPDVEGEDDDGQAEGHGDGHHASDARRDRLVRGVDEELARGLGGFGAWWWVFGER